MHLWKLVVKFKNLDLIIFLSAVEAGILCECRSYKRGSRFKLERDL